jgi:hypothetical protein
MLVVRNNMLARKVIFIGRGLEIVPELRGTSAFPDTC